MATIGPIYPEEGFSMILRKWTRRGKLQVFAGLLGIGLLGPGCESQGPSSPVLTEKEGDVEKREKVIKDFYKSRKKPPIKKTSRVSPEVRIR